MTHLGNEIYYYGDRDVSLGRTNVALDNEDGEQINTTSSTIEYQQLLWSKTDLGPGDHSFVIRHDGPEGQRIRFDYIM